ncbi:MAG: carboxypeptidase-like regulatory domain-containing protein, partial [Gemmatimonadetes bacterium]|nr:carboxypeptidase-like regulatory domain-containing protein [Gemmatimonadota bacterium]
MRTLPRLAARLLVPLTALLLSPASATAQGILGGVRDAEGGPLVGVSIRLDGEFRTSTDLEGGFRITGLPAGPVRLTAERLGFESVSRQVEVPSEGWAEVDIQLRTLAVELNPLVVTGTL